MKMIAGIIRSIGLGTAASFMLAMVVAMWLAFEPVVKPRTDLLRIVVYTWALSTGSIDVDCRTGRLGGFTHHVRDACEDADGQEPYRAWYRVSADLQPGELAALVDAVGRTGLRDFVPSEDDIHHRRAYLDECPPTLVLIWADRKRVFHLPLYNTVKGSLPVDRLNCYQGMNEICRRMHDLEDQYAEPPYIAKPSDSEYDWYSSERERLLDD